MIILFKKKEHLQKKFIISLFKEKVQLNLKKNEKKKVSTILKKEFYLLKAYYESISKESSRLKADS